VPYVDLDGEQIRFGKILIVLGFFLGAHRIGFALAVVPAARLLHDLPAVLDQVDLAGRLALNRTGDRLQRSHILHLCPRAEFLLADGAHGKIDVGPHGAFLHLAVRNAQVLERRPELFEIGDDLAGGAEIGLRDDLDQRYAAPVIIDERAVFPWIVDKLTGILLHMDLMDADSSCTAVGGDVHMSVSADRQVKLRDLIGLWKIRVKIVLAVKLRIARDIAVQCQPGAQREFDNLAVQRGEGSRHPGADLAYMRIRRTAEFCGASAENLCLCR